MLPLLIEAELDDDSATAAAIRAERLFSDASRDIARSFNDHVGGAIRKGGDELEQMAERGRAAYRRIGVATEEVTVKERELAQARERGADTVGAQARQVEVARGREERAIRQAASAYDDYEQAANRAGDAGLDASRSFAGGLRGGLGALRGAGQEVAGGFADGFAGSGALARLGAAGGPIGLALTGIAALGYAGGKALIDQIEQGMASMATQDFFQARLGADDASMQRYGQAAAESYIQGFGSVQENLQSVQYAIQSGALIPSASTQEVEQTIGRLQTLAGGMGEDVQTVATGIGQMLRTGVADSSQQAFDVLTVASQKGLNISNDLLDTVGEYSTQFRSAGLSGGQAIGLINGLLVNGARNTDVAADGMKSFLELTTNQSQTTKEAFGAIGYDAEQMAARIAAGGDSARDALGLVWDGLRNITDPLERNRVGVALLGDKWNDMRDAVTKTPWDTAINSLGQVSGASDDAAKKTAEHADQWDRLGRNIETAWSSMHKWLADTDVGKFFGQSLPSTLADFFDPASAGVSGSGLPNSTKPLNPLDILTAPGAPGAPSPVGPGGLLMPSLQGPPPPGAPPPASPGSITPVPMSVPGAPGAASKPSFDGSLYSVGAIPVQGQIPVSPQAPGAPGARLSVDPGKVFDAQTSEQNARQSVEQARVRVLELEADNTATSQQIAAAKSQVQSSERAYLSAEAKLIEAQRGTWDKANSTISGAMNDLKSVFAPLADDFGISGGLSGIAENLVKIFGNLAFAGAMSQSPDLQSAALTLAANGGVAPGLFNQQFFDPQGHALRAATAAGYSGAGYAVPGAPGAYPGDAALLSHVPATGTYDNNVKDLSRGLADCSSGVEDLVNIMDGKSTVGGTLWTGNASSVLPAMGFQRGMGAPGDFRVGYNDHHMQATLPEGTPFNYGAESTIDNGGVGGSGAFDPSFTDHWYRPEVGGGSPVGAAPIPGDPANTNPALTNPTVAWGAPGLPSGITGGTGQGPVFGATTPGMVGQAAGAPGAAPGMGTGVSFPGSPGGGGGAGGGGLLGAAAAGAAGMVPGGGAAAQIATQATMRSIEFGAQAAGIGVSAFQQTLLPAGSERANNGWFQKIAAGVSGAKPAKPNMAGGPSPLMQGPPGGGQGGQSVDKSTNITNNVTTAATTDDGTARALQFHQQASNAAPGN